MQTLTVKCKLLLSETQREAIDHTMRAFAGACNEALSVGGKLGTASNVRIHQACYYDLRTKHNLSANLAVRAIARAASILKVKARKHSTVHPTSIDYDGRIFSFQEEHYTVSLATVEGRLKGIALSVGAYQRSLLQGQRPSSAVLFRNRQGAYYLGIHVKVATPAPVLDADPAWLGVGVRQAHPPSVPALRHAHRASVPELVEGHPRFAAIERHSWIETTASSIERA